MGIQEDLEKRVQALEDIEAIKKLKARYFRSIDKKAWDELRDVFTEDAYGDYNRLGIKQGRETIVNFIKGFEGSSTVVTTHQGHNSEIELTGENTAKGSWEMDYYRADSSDKSLIRDGIFYEDEYNRDADGKWRIRSLKIIVIRSDISKRE